jgi:hypothetical protein
MKSSTEILELLKSRLEWYSTEIEELEAEISTEEWDEECHDRLEGLEWCYNELEDLISTIEK